MLKNLRVVGIGKCSTRQITTSLRVLNQAPLIPDHIRNERLIQTIPAKLGKDEIQDPEFSRLRVVPELTTYYGGNAAHDATINRLNSLIRKYLNLPTRLAEEASDIKFLSFPEYKDVYIKSEKVKVAHHRQLLSLLNRLKSIDGELMPKEVVDVLNEFVSGTNQSAVQSKIVRTLDENGIGRARGVKKSSTANISIVKGEGLIMVNGVNYTSFFTRPEDRNKITFPLLAIDKAGEFNVFANVNGGGISSQADAVRLGLIKVLGQLNSVWKSRLNSANLRPTDTRIVERKKPGKVKARKSPTWVKR